MLPYRSGCTIVQKTHEPIYEEYQGEFGNIGKTIILIRNPYKALVSWRNFQESSDDHVGHGDAKIFNGAGYITIFIYLMCT